MISAAQDVNGASRVAASSTGARIALGVLGVVAVMLAMVGPDRVGGAALRAFDAYVDAQQKMLEAAGNLTADGRSEFAVLLADGAAAEDLRAAIGGIGGVRFEREANLPGWIIVTTAPGNRDALDQLLARPEARLVVPNRGLWICH